MVPAGGSAPGDARRDLERFQPGDSSGGSMTQLNPTSDTDTTSAIDCGA
jgi:hypothetical protein